MGLTGDEAKQYLTEHAPRLSDEITNEIKHTRTQIRVFMLATTMLSDPDAESFTRTQLAQSAGLEETTETIGKDLDRLEEIGLLAIDTSDRPYEYTIAHPVSHWQHETESNAPDGMSQSATTLDRIRNQQHVHTLSSAYLTVCGHLWETFVVAAFYLAVPFEYVLPEPTSEKQKLFEQKWARCGSLILFCMIPLLRVGIIGFNVALVIGTVAWSCIAAVGVVWTMRHIELVYQRHIRQMSVNLP